MTFKDYIDKCSWEDLKTTNGAREYMQHSLAELKSIEPTYTDDTAKATIHFEETDPSKYKTFILKEGNDKKFSYFGSSWDEVLPLEVKTNEVQTLSDNEIVIIIIDELTFWGATIDERDVNVLNFQKNFEKIQKVLKEKMDLF